MRLPSFFAPFALLIINWRLVHGNCDKNGGQWGCIPTQYCTGSTTGYWAHGECKDCPAGNYCPGGYASVYRANKAIAIPCNPGKYSGAAAATCTDCAAGKYSGATAATAESTCTDCAAGKYSGAAAATTCTDCAAGKYSGAAAATAESTCTDCAAGKHSGTAAATCTDCATGKYSGAAATTCTDCGAGKFSTTPRADTYEVCKFCAAGKYSGAGSNSCTDCSSGTYSSTEGGTSASSCKPCPTDSFTSSPGEQVCQQCKELQVAPEGSSQCNDCPAGEVPSVDKSVCVTCPGGQYASGGKCVKDAPPGANNENAVEGILANNGTPFYIMAIMVVIAGGLGFAVHSSKKMVPGVLILPDTAHVLHFMLNSAGMMSELVLGVAVVSSGMKQLVPFGVMLLLSRVVVGVTPGVMVFTSIFSGSKVPAVDEATGKKALKYYICGDVIVGSSKLYVAVLTLAVIEPTLLAFLPWYDTEMARAARFPTLSFMKRVYMFEMLQLLVTLAAQLCIIFQTQGDGGTFGIIVIMNVCFSAIMLGVKGFDMFLKWGLLRGAAKDEDCEAARNAWKKVQKERSAADDGVELSDVYDDGTEAAADGGSRGNTFVSNNPMHTTSPEATAMEGEEREGLLALFVTREEQHRDREELRRKIQLLERRQDSLEREAQGTIV